MDRREMLRIIRDVLTCLETEPSTACLFADQPAWTRATIKYGAPCDDEPKYAYGVAYHDPSLEGRCHDQPPPPATAPDDWEDGGPPNEKF